MTEVKLLKIKKPKNYVPISNGRTKVPDAAIEHPRPYRLRKVAEQFRKFAKFVRFDVQSPLAKCLLYSESPMLHKKHVEVLQVMVVSGSWVLAEYVVLPQSN